MKRSFGILVMIAVVGINLLIGLHWSEWGNEREALPGEEPLGPEWREVDPPAHYYRALNDGTGDQELYRGLFYSAPAEPVDPFGHPWIDGRIKEDGEWPVQPVPPAGDWILGAPYAGSGGEGREF